MQHLYLPTPVLVEFLTLSASDAIYDWLQQRASTLYGKFATFDHAEVDASLLQRQDALIDLGLA